MIEEEEGARRKSEQVVCSSFLDARGKKTRKKTITFFSHSVGLPSIADEAQGKDGASSGKQE